MALDNRKSLLGRVQDHEAAVTSYLFQPGEACCPGSETVSDIDTILGSLSTFCNPLQCN